MYRVRKPVIYLLQTIVDCAWGGHRGGWIWLWSTSDMSSWGMNPYLVLIMNEWGSVDCLESSSRKPIKLYILSSLSPLDAGVDAALQGQPAEYISATCSGWDPNTTLAGPCSHHALTPGSHYPIFRKLKTHSPIYCIKDNWENVFNLTHSTECIWQAFQCLPISFHNDENEMVLCANNWIRSASQNVSEYLNLS